jgi:hypothetical protein
MNRKIKQGSYLLRNVNAFQVIRSSNPVSDFKVLKASLIPIKDRLSNHPKQDSRLVEVERIFTLPETSADCFEG